MKKILFIILSLSLLTECGIYRKTDARKIPGNVNDRVQKNLEEGKRIKFGGGGGKGNGNFSFATSNEMWRATIEILDFIPLNTVDYSGGMIISDWYTSDNSNESIKISIRFLTNEIRSDGIKIIVHKKKCTGDRNCKVALLSNSKISQELRSSILQKAAVLEKESKNKKKR